MLAGLWRNSHLLLICSAFVTSDAITMEQLGWNEQSNMNRNLKINTLWWHKFILVLRK